VDESPRRRWHHAVILVGAAYFVVGLTFAALAGSTSSPHARVTWRLVAWAISALAFAAHIAYERFRLRDSPATTAFHASLGVALGAFGLAVAANVKAQSSASIHGHSLLLVALVAWPLLTAVPAFAVALGAAALLALRRRTT
jgi:phosphoglycerol transferase MdoB-like AlkP superfamily enzyme